MYLLIQIVFYYKYNQDATSCGSIFYLVAKAKDFEKGYFKACS
jgi:hypothetical protein